MKYKDIIRVYRGDVEHITGITWENPVCEARGLDSTEAPQVSQQNLRDGGSAVLVVSFHPRKWGYLMLAH